MVADEMFGSLRILNLYFRILKSSRLRVGMRRRVTPWGKLRRSDAE